jgi:hypothetical protein
MSQTYGQFEVVITDNSDDDATEELIEGAWTDDRIRYVRNSRNLGMNGNAIKCLGMARGEYVTFTPDDDIWISPEKLAWQIASMEEHGLAVAFSDAVHFLSPGDLEMPRIYRQLGPQKMPQDLEIVPNDVLIPGRAQPGQFLSILTALIHRRLLEEFRRSWSFGSEELFMWRLGFAARKARLGFDRRPLVAIRDGDHNWEVSTPQGLVNYRRSNSLRVELIAAMLQDLAADQSLTGSEDLNAARKYLWRHACSLSLPTAWRLRREFQLEPGSHLVSQLVRARVIDRPRRMLGGLRRRVSHTATASAPRH